MNQGAKVTKILNQRKIKKKPQGKNWEKPGKKFAPQICFLLTYTIDNQFFIISHKR